MSASKDRAKETALQKAREQWLSCIKQWFPNLHDRTYFLPPVYFSRVSYREQTIADHSVLIPQPTVDRSVQTMDDSYKALSLKTSRPVFDSDARHDNAQFRVLHCLQELAEKRKEVMVVVSQLEFGKYLHKPSYTAAAEQLPRLKDLPRHYQRGDFDVLIIHSKYGLITGEVSSVGTNFTLITPAEKSTVDKIAEKVEKAITQLIKARDVLTHLVSDLPHIDITPSLMLPSLSRQQLLHAVTGKQAEKALCDCLGAKTISQALGLCLCADNLSPSDSPWDVSDIVMDALESWWKRCFAAARLASGIPRDVYEQLVARFCGPATTVEIPRVRPTRLEIRTEGEGVGLVGDTLTKLCLYPEQVNVLNKAQSRVFLTGPPGTGKTIMLYLQAMRWLLEGHDVHVVSAYYCSRAVSLLLEHQLQKSLSEQSNTEVASTPKVFRHDFDFDMNKGDVDLAVATLKRVTTDGQLYVIVDEIVRLTSDRFGDFCTQLISAVPDVHLWVASVFNSKIPVCLIEERVTVALRTPPVVTRQIQLSLEINLGGLQYTTNGVPAPTDGAVIRHLFHNGRPDHDPDATSNTECENCGRDIAGVLTELQVGVNDQSERRQELRLHYLDVLVVCENPIDFVSDNLVQMTSQCSGIVSGLRAGGFPVCVVDRQASEAALRDMALGTEDKVIVAHWKTVQGLEKKVVVVTGQWGGGYDRLLLASRCTSQLIWVDPPP